MPFFNIVTDSISLNSLWWRAGADGWFVPNAESAEVMRDAGVDEEQVWVTGFPVRRVFAEQAGGPTVPDPAGGTAPRVLQIVNSGTRHAAETAELLFRETDWAITCTVGRDEALRARLGAAAARRKAPTTILGWTEEIPRLLMTHHVVVSKAGGATTQEALAARCPMIVNQIVPGQEEGNYELLRRHWRVISVRCVIGGSMGAYHSKCLPRYPAYSRYCSCSTAQLLNCLDFRSRWHAGAGVGADGRPSGGGDGAVLS